MSTQLKLTKKLKLYKATVSVFFGLSCIFAPSYAAEDFANSVCIDSFNLTRSKFQKSNTQSILVLSWDNMFLPFITFQGPGKNDVQYSLWQTLNGDIRGYATRDGKGFDFVNNLESSVPLAWHPTFIWDRLFSSTIPLKNFTCVLTGRTRIMGKRVSILRLVPQEGLRYSYVIAKEDENDFPVELSVLDTHGNLASRITTIDSRIVAGIDFPIKDYEFDAIEEQFSAQVYSNSQEAVLGMDPLYDKGANLQKNTQSSSELNSLNKEQSTLPLNTPEKSLANTQSNLQETNSNLEQSVNNREVAKATPSLKPKLTIWSELQIPNPYQIIGGGKCQNLGAQCLFQEFSDGITSFRVYRNQRSTVYYPVLNNGLLTIVRKNNYQYEFSVVGEVPVALGEYVLEHIDKQ